MSLNCIRKTSVFMNSLWRIRYHELKSNNIDIDKETLSFHINTCLREHEEIHGTAINRKDRDNISAILCDFESK